MVSFLNVMSPSASHPHRSSRRAFFFHSNPPRSSSHSGCTPHSAAGLPHWQKVRAYLASNPEAAKTLETLLATDKTSHPNPKDRTTTNGLMWLLRGLKFTALSLRINLTNKNEELSTSFTKGYDGSLKKWHGMMVRPIFYVSERVGAHLEAIS